MTQLQTVCVLGLGYIGLPTASLLGTKGFKVLGVDVSREVVDTINRGEIHIVEPDLDVLVKSAVNSGNLFANTEPGPADVFIVAVPTPFKENHQPDLSYVESAIRSICPHIRSGNLIILESTSPVGTTENVVGRMLEESGYKVGSDVYVAHCPERVLPGRILAELIENDRIVGGIDPESTRVAARFYELFVSGDVIETDSRTAELAKLTENAFRDVNIAFANELSLICDEQRINVWELIQLANRHPRVNILNPGPGVGGHCIAVDPWFIITSAPKTSRLMRAAREVNDSKPQWVINRVKMAAARFKAPVIGCLGVTFKADIDDLRESPALEIARQLQTQQVGSVLVAEPNLRSMDEFDVRPLEEVIERSDIVLLLVDHKQFKQLDATSLSSKILIDTRGIII
jgi:UDP-N-acetyl-D-mannosaminuronic acid dehydrogenase